MRGEGAYLFDHSGHRLLDAGAHLGAGQVGHGRGEIADRMAAQARELEFVALDSGISHPVAVELAGRLAELLPLEDPVLSFTTSGSEANELALKIARAFHARRGDPQRIKVLSRDGSRVGKVPPGPLRAPYLHGAGLAASSAQGRLPNRRNAY